MTHKTAVRCSLCGLIVCDTDWTPDEKPPTITAANVCAGCRERSDSETKAIRDAAREGWKVEDARMEFDKPKGRMNP